MHNIVGAVGYHGVLPPSDKENLLQLMWFLGNEPDCGLCLLPKVQILVVTLQSNTTFYQDMDAVANRIMEVAALGRPFSLGMLYDCRQESLIPGLTLWDRHDLEKETSEKLNLTSDFEIVTSESIEDKLSALNVEASLKASFLGGLVEVEGSAKYLNDQKTSNNQARVTLKYKTTTKFQQLSMNHLGRGNVKHPYVFDKGIATHVVTGILYGAQAFFVFDREVSEIESHQDIQGNLKVMIKKIPSFSIEGEGSLKMQDKDLANVEKFSCKFHGDFSLEKNPVSFQDAVEVYQSLPKLLGHKGENAVPVKVWLLPLASLDSNAAKLVRQISIRLVQEAQSVLEDLSELEMRCNDAMRATTTQQFSQICKKFRAFKEMCSEFKLEFQRNLEKKLPLIRGGDEEEAVLAEILKKRHSSPFNSKNLNEWMDCKEREICILKSFTRMMRNTKIIPSRNVLHEESLGAEHALCFVFTSLESPEPYLSVLSDYLKEPTKPGNNQDPHTYDIEKEQWYLSNNVLDEMRKKAKLFIDFAEANKENQNIRFLTVGLKDETQKGSSIYIYKDGFSVSENFEPPSKPETVTVSDINHNSVTLKISPPTFGAENITSYSVEYCVSGEDGWQQKTAAKSEDVTVSDLRLKTQYMFRCRAMTSVGVGPANEVSGSIKTLPCSPPAKPQVEPNSTEISVSWEKPAELGQDVQVLSYIVEYATTDNRVKEEDLEWNQTMSRAEKVIISELQSGTEYVVRVRCDCGVAGSSKESSSVKVCTTKREFARLAEYLKHISKRINSESLLYKLPLREEDIDIDGCCRYNFGKESMRQNRTIMLLGATGAGKSTLINGMINYIAGVEWKDNFRFKLIDEGQSRSQAESQTSEVTVYKINHHDGFNIPYSLTVVDTPGFGDTRGVARDKEITEQIRKLFTSATGVSEIDAVCFVTQASIARLTATQRYVFDSVLSIFGKDVEENIEMLVTFADGKQPPVLKAINVSGVPYPKNDIGLPVHFKFNNSALFADNRCTRVCDEVSDGDKFDEMFWNMGAKSMKKFFTALANDNEKRGCAAVDNAGMCTVCPGKCVWNVHFNQTYRWEYVRVKEKQTLQELKDEYEKATKEKMTVQQLIERQEEEILRLQGVVVSLMDQSATCITRLQEIALRPNPLTTPEYIDMLIEGEKSEAKEGYQARIKSLEAMKEGAKIISKVAEREKLTKTEQELAEERDERQKKKGWLKKFSSCSSTREPPDGARSLHTSEHRLHIAESSHSELNSETGTGTDLTRRAGHSVRRSGESQSAGAERHRSEPWSHFSPAWTRRRSPGDTH
ncbi:hypothetical protein Q5P01_022923 [Channa striata]|uniref:Fibronectin type-III domain-containing protein n=1 Tax=Channa striata TaxID=64152 RepID=A0AA88LRV8_CHASR|nr:hypothetical protein Q5P01_022923 [Channa striata]